MSEGQPPIVEQDYIAGVTVVDIGDARVARGMSRRPYSSCCHYALVYDSQERRVWCKDCEQNVDPFDAFHILVGQFHTAAQKNKRDREEIEQARAANIHRIAAREMERHWRSKRHVPLCPHCKSGILPEDVDRMAFGSKELELARRKKAERRWKEPTP